MHSSNVPSTTRYGRPPSVGLTRSLLIDGHFRRTAGASKLIGRPVSVILFRLVKCLHQTAVLYSHGTIGLRLVRTVMPAQVSVPKCSREARQIYRSTTDRTGPVGYQARPRLP